ncbi:hypothetical protein PIB30_093128 [Stylosanthes scabra]|uniref:Uncharacterized protein n=1 Tax=Stylosanthes scabra TaxID=79078 RepID=A0ABU6ZUD6_9FABA|nr:hypothetical protein [Stylosanthes scabra]
MVKDPSCAYIRDEGEFGTQVLGLCPLSDSESEIEDPQVTRLRMKISCLKIKIRDTEWRMKVVAAVGLIGWVRFLYLWMSTSGNVRVARGVPLNLG